MKTVWLGSADRLHGGFEIATKEIVCVNYPETERDSNNDYSVSVKVWLANKPTPFTFYWVCFEEEYKMVETTERFFFWKRKVIKKELVKYSVLDAQETEPYKEAMACYNSIIEAMNA